VTVKDGKVGIFKVIMGRMVVYISFPSYRTIRQWKGRAVRRVKFASINMKHYDVSELGFGAGLSGDCWGDVVPIPFLPMRERCGIFRFLG
jgi:hypothetical protein